MIEKHLLLDKIFRAIYAKFKADSALYKAGVGLTTTWATRNVPFICVVLISAVPLDFTSTSVLLQFSIFSGKKSSEEACKIYGLLKACYDDYEVVMAGYSPVKMRWDSARLMRDPGGGWHYACDCTLLMQSEE